MVQGEICMEDDFYHFYDILYNIYNKLHICHILYGDDDDTGYSFHIYYLLYLLRMELQGWRCLSLGLQSEKEIQNDNEMNVATIRKTLNNDNIYPSSCMLFMVEVTKPLFFFNKKISCHGSQNKSSFTFGTPLSPEEFFGKFTRDGLS